MFIPLHRSSTHKTLLCGIGYCFRCRIEYLHPRRVFSCHHTIVCLHASRIWRRLEFWAAIESAG